MAPRATSKIFQLESAKGGDPVEFARRERAAAEARLAEINARENEAVISAEDFAAWRRERDVAIAEVDRCRKLVERLELAAAEDAETARRVAQRARAVDQLRANEALARRIREEGGPAIDTLLKLARDVASAAIVDAEINAQLPEDDDKITSADVLARFRLPASREVLSEKKISLWTFVSTGSIVGNQDDVVKLDDGSGYLIGGHNNILCIRRDFWQIEYREAEPRIFFKPFYAALRLPNVDGPGFAVDLREDASPAAALQALERRAAGERAVLTEIVAYRPAAAKS